jgi:hypothetical protein
MDFKTAPQIGRKSEKSIRKLQKPEIAYVCSYTREEFYKFVFRNPPGDDQFTNSA